MIWGAERQVKYHNLTCLDVKKMLLMAVFTNQLRFTQQMWQIERRCGGCSATCNCPLHDQFGRGLLIWTDLYADLQVVARAGLLWGNLVRRAVGSLWGVTISDLMWLECVSTFWMIKELMLLTVLRVSPTLDWIKHLWERETFFFFLVLTHIYVVLTSIFNNLLTYIYRKSVPLNITHENDV